MKFVVIVIMKSHHLCPQSFFRKHAPSEKGPYGISSEVMDTYVKSCGESVSVGYNRAVCALPAEHILTHVVCLVTLQLVTVSSHTS